MFFPYRDDAPRHSFPLVTVAIILGNVLVQFYQSAMSAERAALFLRAAGAVPLEIVSLTDIVRWPDQPVALVPIPLTLLTAMFVHGGWLHLISNMWYLWLFGDNVEDALGHGRFLLFYLLTGLLAFAVQIATGATSLIPTVGASGAIAGVLGAYAVQFPRARIRCLAVIIIFITTVEVPAIIVLGLWFLLQVLQSAGDPGGGVAWFAHIGGFVAGMALVRLFARARYRPPPPLD